MKIIFDENSGTKKFTIIESNGKYYYMDTTSLPEFMCYSGPTFETGIFQIDLPESLYDKVNTMEVHDISQYINWDDIKIFQTDSWEEALENHKSILDGFDEIIKRYTEEF